MREEDISTGELIGRDVRGERWEDGEDREVGDGGDDV